jgi:hypothetical protein
MMDPLSVGTAGADSKTKRRGGLVNFLGRGGELQTVVVTLATVWTRKGGSRAAETGGKSRGLV